MFLLSFDEVRPNYLVLSFSVESLIFDVEVRGDTCKKDYNKQVSDALRCLCVYNLDE